MVTIVKKSKKNKLIYDGYYFDGKNRFDLFKNENGKIIKRRKK